MPDNPNPLDRAVSIAVAVEEKGLGLKARSRAVSAVDGLIGAAVDILIAPLEGIAGRQRAKDQARVEVLQAAGQVLKDRVLTDQSAAAAVLESAMVKEAESILRRRDVLAIAADELRALPPPDENVATSDDEADVLDEDWLNIFGVYVDRASSDRLKKMWGQILSGEIRKPNSFSLSTLRVISELDQNIAETFERWAGFRTDDGFVPRPAHVEGNNLLEGLFLEECGLISNTESPLLRKYVTDHNCEAHFVFGNYVLRITSPTPNAGISYTASPLTRVGRELSTILPAPGGEGVIMRVVPILTGDISTKQLLALESLEENGRITSRYIRDL